MKRKHCQYIIALAILLGSYSCSFVDTINLTFNPKPRFKDQNKNYVFATIENFLSDSITVTKAEEMFLELPQFVGKEINIYDAVHYYNDGRIILKIQSPDNPKHIDEYTFQHQKWLGPKPIKNPSEKKIDESIYPISEFSFTTACKVAQLLKEKSEQVGDSSPITHVYAVVRQGKLIWYPTSITNTRETYYIKFTETGELISFELE